jgi:AcrR family transcriptional regulator
VSVASRTTPERSTYHHGALRQALVRAGLELARRAGAEAIVLREATRRVGVSARAAYRHFADRDALVQAVAEEALAKMAAGMARRQCGATSAADLLRGVGEGYIAFALDEPGWFDVAVRAMPDLLGATPAMPEVDGASSTGPRAGATDAGTPDRSPCGLLLGALAGLVREGALDPARLPEAAVTCWSGVHGFAVLASRGPLSRAPRAVIDDFARRHVTALVTAVTSGR